MNIIHGTWLPKDTDGFIQSGTFCLWVESDEAPPKIKVPLHPQHLPEKPCLEFLKTELLLNPIGKGQGELLSLLLPTVDGKPLPSPELHSVDLTGTITLQDWQVYGFPLEAPLKAINNIHFLCCYQASHSRVGSDFLFWYYFSQSLKHILAKDQYLPLLTSKKAGKTTEFYRRWQAVSGNYEQLIHSAVAQMPLACSQHYQPESLLRHFAEVVIDELLNVAAADMPQVFSKRFQDEFLASMLLFKHSAKPLQISLKLPDEVKQWHQWQQKLLGSEQHSSLQLGLQLLEASAVQVDEWRLVFFLSSHQDPSLKLDLEDFWADKTHFHKALQKQFGNNIEQQLLIQLALAARIYPTLWQGMENSEPDSVQLNLEAAFDFLKESAWILEDAGFKVIVPAWLTPKGRRRAKIRMRSSGKSPSKSATSTSYFSMENLTNYQYELAIGDTVLTPTEWQQLVDSKAPLIHFRGQWMELDRDKMQEMLSFMQQQHEDVPEMTVQQLLKKLAEESDSFELDVHDSLAQMLEKLVDNSQLEAIENPKQLNAELREYQKRGVSWLRYLENLGLNGCLADDMGLGKTMQVISLLVLEREHQQPAPTLLIVPTSVIGNWQKEIEKFAPHLSTHIHHSSGREQDSKAFKKLCGQHDVLITSYTLARKDAKLLGEIHWRRIVLDEAQNIKNPVAAQTKAILKLEADSRLALTGTPVENRLMDLWSIFNFLNPGYLGKQAQFRKTYELPVQRDNDPIQSNILKKLIQPFILRRLKTDKNIIKDLPDKIENKVYCNLSKEQASLYEVVVKNVVAQLEETDGIQRQGLMLSTLMKLKQICNHPMQFLQDGSAFTPERSHKLERIGDMLEEAMAQGDSVLVFTQFTEIGEHLNRYLTKEKHYKTHYLHGGTTRAKREQMIADFQDPDSGPAVFILSLKAGGVGITLTAANHVFHFDRWWNPAVENQATDRAFRIGQQKNVFVHKFVTLGTLEERIDQMITDKQKMADSIVGNDESWLTKLDNQAFNELIALNKHSIMEN